MNEELVGLGEHLRLHVSKWRLPLGVDTEEVVNETLVRWLVKKADAHRIQGDARAWLLGAAKNIKRELTRTVNAFPRLGDADTWACKPSICRRASANVLTSSTVWQSFSAKQKHVLTETIMFDRPVAEVAAEVQVNRSTAKSWVKRLPKRLAADPTLQARVTAEVNFG